MLEELLEALIVAAGNFVMVFLVLGGLAGAIVGLKRLVQFWERERSKTTPDPRVRLETASESRKRSPEPEQPQKNQTESHIVAILAAIEEFTGLPLGSFQIDTIEPLEKVPVSPHIAVIAAAIHEFTSMPQGAFRIVGIKHLGTVDIWKMAGRLELMGFDVD
jgi:hypothetical protein